MKHPNYKKKAAIKKLLYCGNRLSFSKEGQFKVNCFQFFIEDNKYYMSNPLYRDYGIGTCFIKTQILAGKIYVVQQRYKYIEVDSNSFYHCLWNMMRKCEKCIAFTNKANTQITIPIWGRREWDL